MKLDQATATGYVFTLVASVAAAPSGQRLSPAIVDRSVATPERAAGIVAKHADPMPEPKAATVISISRDAVTKSNKKEA